MGLCFDDNGFERIVGEIVALAVESASEVLECRNLWGLLGRGRNSFRRSNDRFPERWRKRIKRREVASRCGVYSVDGVRRTAHGCGGSDLCR